MSDITIRCKYEELVNPNKLKDHPLNKNRHSADQIERLVKLYEYQGIRHPVIVSNQSGFIVAGHARKMAAVKSGVKEFPVVYQDFENEEMEYSFLIGDNAAALWAELDFAGINNDLANLGPDFDIDWLGIRNFTLDLSEKDVGFDPESKEGEKEHKMCPHCGEAL